MNNTPEKESISDDDLELEQEFPPGLTPYKEEMLDRKCEALAEWLLDIYLDTLRREITKDNEVL